MSGDLTFPSRQSVLSVFGRQGAVVAANGDYAASQITFTPSGFVSDTDTQAALATIISTISALNTALADFKGSVRVATTANINLTSAPSSVDGVTLSSGNRVLVKDQSTGSQNGIYVFNGAGSAMTRATDADASAEVTAGMLVVATEGTANADTLWQLTTNDTITLGTTALTFAQVSSSGGLTMEEIEDNLAAGVLVSGYNTLIEYDDAANTFTWHEALRICSDADASTITFDLSDDHTDANAGSWHATEEITADRTLAITNAGIGTNNAPGKRFQVQLNYDTVGGHVVTWWPNINWVNRYPPAFTPVGGGSDTFEFVVTSIDEYGVPTCEGWVLSTERGVMATVVGESATPTWGTLDDNLTGYWRFEETSGNRASEVGSRTLTDNNTVTSAVGQFGTAASFASASSEYLSRTHEAALGPQSTVNSGEFSIAVWVRFTTLTGTIVSKADWGSGVDAPNWRLDYDGSGIRFATTLDDESNFELTHSATITTGTWYFIVAVIDPTNTRLRISIDGGAFENSSSWGGGKSVKADPTNGTTLRVGAGDLGGSASNFLNGRLDELAIYQRALTIGEVGSLMAGISFGSINTVDVSICEGADITLTGSGTHSVTVENLIPLKMLLIKITNDGASGTLAFSGPTFVWPVGGAPSLPADGDTIYLLIQCVDTTTLLARLWHA